MDSMTVEEKCHSRISGKFIRKCRLQSDSNFARTSPLQSNGDIVNLPEGCWALSRHHEGYPSR